MPLSGRVQRPIDEAVLYEASQLVDAEAELLRIEPMVGVSWRDRCSFIRDAVSSPFFDLEENIPFPGRQRFKSQSFL